MFDLIIQHQETVITLFHVIIYCSSLILVLFLAIYNALYLMRILNTNKRVGIHPPKHIHYLVRVSILLSLFTAGILTVFLVRTFLVD